MKLVVKPIYWSTFTNPFRVYLLSILLKKMTLDYQWLERPDELFPPLLFPNHSSTALSRPATRLSPAPFFRLLRTPGPLLPPRLCTTSFPFPSSLFLFYNVSLFLSIFILLLLDFFLALDRHRLFGSIQSAHAWSRHLIIFLRHTWHT